jgi:hypothetical protein
VQRGRATLRLIDGPDAASLASDQHNSHPLPGTQLDEECQYLLGSKTVLATRLPESSAASVMTQICSPRALAARESQAPHRLTKDLQLRYWEHECHTLGPSQDARVSEFVDTMSNKISGA